MLSFDRNIRLVCTANVQKSVHSIQIEKEVLDEFGLNHNKFTSLANYSIPPFTFKHIRLIPPQCLKKGFYNLKLTQRIIEEHPNLEIFGMNVPVDPNKILRLAVRNHDDKVVFTDIHRQRYSQSTNSRLCFSKSVQKYMHAVKYAEN